MLLLLGIIFNLQKSRDEQTDQNNIKTFYGNKPIEIFTYDLNLSPEKALQEFYTENKKNGDSQLCVVLPLAENNIPVPSGRHRYTIGLSEIELNKWAEKFGTDIPNPPCGNYGYDFDNGGNYFEFQDQTPGVFMYVDVGQDTPLFRPDSIMLQ